MANFFKDWKKKQEESEKIDLGTLYDFDPPKENSNMHYFLGEELMTPFANHTDCQREQMFSSHLAQTVHLVKPEFPKVFTNFETQFGEYSVGYKKAEADFTIIAKIVKNAYNYDLIIQYNSSKVYDVIHIRKAQHITEEYGYGKDDCVADKKVGDVVKEGSFIYKTPNYDNDGNFMYGVNLKTAYVEYKNLTYEDAIVISKSAAKKLTSYKAEEVTISVNTNDILLDIYNNGEEEYHSFPHVGEHTLGNVLVASRREEGQNLLYNFQFDKMSKIQSTDDITYTNGGEIVDIDIYSNASLEMLKKKDNAFIKELVILLENQTAYYRTAAEELDKILPPAKEKETMSVMTPSEIDAYKAERSEYGFNWTRPAPEEVSKVKYTDEFGYYWKQVHEWLDSRIQWRTKGKSFQNCKLKFTVLKENELIPGTKITNRYGGKGTIALIEDDDKMPTTEDGFRADVCYNRLGVVNRLNPSQLWEQHINFMSDHVIEDMKKAEDLEDKVDIYLSYIKYLNKRQYEFMSGEFITMNRKDKEQIIADIIEKGIFVHEPPFFKNTDFEALKRIKIDHPEWCTRYKCVGIERPLVIGDIYFIKLKHEASNKTSMVSASMTNTKSQPTKSNLKKNHKLLYQNSPISLGNMETKNLLITKNSEVLEKLLKAHSTSKIDRENLIKQLLTAENPFDVNIELDPDMSINRKILEKYFSILELSLEQTNSDDEE